MSEKKIAIVCSGGGMRSAYTGGALVALAKEHGLVKPDIIIAASGSAAFALYYLTEQYDAIREIATKLLSTEKFISYSRLRRIMDIDYLIDTVFKKQQPFDTEKLHRTSTRYFIAITEAETGNVRYISNNDRLDIFEVLRASKAIPVFFRKKIAIEGRWYIDGTLSATFENCLEKARELGATHIIGIDNRARKDFNSAYRSSDVTLIASPKLPVHLLTRDSKSLTQAFEKGYQDVRANLFLRSFLGKKA